MASLYDYSIEEALNPRQIKKSMDIKVTEMAKSRLDNMGVSDEVFLRIGVKSGGCSGNTYDALLDDNMQEFDDVYYTVRYYKNGTSRTWSKQDYSSSLQKKMDKS